MSESDWLDEVFIQPYLRGKEPFNVTVSGRLPKDSDYMIFNVPYTVIKQTIRQHIERIEREARLSEARLFKANIIPEQMTPNEINKLMDNRLAELQKDEE